MADEKKTLWVASNRVDDRVVLFERDPEHPGGEAFVGGDSVDCVARTAEVDRLLRNRELVEIDEPPDEIDGKTNPRKPLQTVSPFSERVATQPGQPTALGRDFSRMEGVVKVTPKLEAQQKDAPKELPVPVGVEQVSPEMEERERRATRR